MEKYIWYNPELDQYQIGSKEEFEKKRSHSEHPSDFEIEYRLSELSVKLADQMVHKLNTVNNYKVAN